MYAHDEESEKALTTDVVAKPRARMRQKSQVTVPNEVRDALHIAEGDEIEFIVTRDGHVSLQGLKVIPADQAWFWTPEWQAGEREASAEIAAGGSGKVYYDLDSFFESLDREHPA